MATARIDRGELARRALDGCGSGPAASSQATSRALPEVGDAMAVMLVEGTSDQIAVETAAVARGGELQAEQVVIVPIGGAHVIGHVLARVGPLSTRVRLAALCDLREEEVFWRGLVATHPESARAGTGSQPFERYVCVKDLEDERGRHQRSRRSSTPRATSGRSTHCRTSPPGAAGRSPRRCGGSSAAAHAASCAHFARAWAAAAAGKAGGLGHP